MLRAKDIANMLGISPSTVSLVLNNKPGISEARRDQIINKINELGCGYILKKEPQNGRNLGFIVYKRTGKMLGESPFFSIFMDGLNKSVRDNGYSLMFFQIDKAESLNSQFDQIKNSSCEGLILLASEMLADDIQPFKALGIPLIIFDNYFDGEDIDAVSINNYDGTLKAVKYLVELGHQKIGYIKSKVFINSFQERIEGYFNALKYFGLKVEERYIYSVGYSEEASFKDMMSYLNKDTELPTALIADNDMLAFGAMRALLRKGYKIPDDISIVGFDDRPICLLADPKLTTIHVPKNIFGSLATELLIQRIDNIRLEALHVEVSTVLIVRKSSEKPKQFKRN